MSRGLICRLFRQYLLLVLVNQMASALFRLIGAMGRNMIVANTFGTFSLLILLALGGVLLSRGNCKPVEFQSRQNRTFFLRFVP